MRRSMVMAMDRCKLIGREGGLPWRISADLKHFKRLTLNKPVIVGRRTFSEDIKRPLPNRLNIVVTRDESWAFEGVEVVSSLESAYRVAAESFAEEAFVIGGAQLCRAAMADIQRLYLTVVDAEFEGDTWFDSFDFSDWRIASQQPLGEGAGSDWPLTFYTLDKI